jgi:hypothetical protein
MIRREVFLSALTATGRRRTLVRNAAWVGAIVAVTLVASSVTADASASGRCAPRATPLSSAANPKKKKKKKHVFLKTEGEGFRVRFDDSRGARADVVSLTTAEGSHGKLAPGDSLDASMSIYLRSGDGVMFPGYDDSGHPSPSAMIVGITPSGDVDVCVQIDAGVSTGERPGTYTTSVGVTGPDLDYPSAIPVVVTFRSSRLVAIGFALGGVLIGLLVKMFTELGASQSLPNGAPRSVREYIRNWSFPTAIILGAISGWLGYVEIYQSDSVWGVSSTDWLRLFGTCFVFQLAGIGAIDLGRRLVGS